MAASVCTALLLAATTAGSDDQWVDDALTVETARAIGGVLGNTDPAALARLAATIPPPQLITAIYRGDRSQRLAALEACGHLSDPWPALPYLAAVMGAPERQVASRATEALLGDLARECGSPDRDVDLVPGQAAQLAAQLAGLAADERLDPDVRASALAAMAMVHHVGGGAVRPDAELFEDGEAAVRGAALAMLTPPLDETLLIPVAEMAAGDDDERLRGQAAGLLCENALSHGVTAPSPDLRKLLAALVADPTAPAEALAPVLGCLVRFSPASRADLVEAALRHPAPAVRSYWEELNGEAP